MKLWTKLKNRQLGLNIDPSLFSFIILSEKLFASVKNEMIDLNGLFLIGKLNYKMYIISSSFAKQMTSLNLLLSANFSLINFIKCFFTTDVPDRVATLERSHRIRPSGIGTRPIRKLRKRSRLNCLHWQWHAGLVEAEPWERLRRKPAATGIPGSNWHLNRLKDWDVPRIWGPDCCC